MDDRYYLVVYDLPRMRCCNDTVLLPDESYVKDVVLPSYEFCEVNGHEAIRKARFTEVSGKLYELQPETKREVLATLDAMVEPDLKRHQAMAADDDRLYNVYVYVAE